MGISSLTGILIVCIFFERCLKQQCLFHQIKLFMAYVIVFEIDTNQRMTETERSVLNPESDSAGYIFHISRIIYESCTFGYLFL